MDAAPSPYRQSILEYIRREAQPPDKFSHQPRLYQLASTIGEGLAYDDDVLYAAAWLHDLGVFFGHRPSDPAELAAWDNVAYAVRAVPALLKDWAFPESKIAAVAEAIRTHLPSQRPTSVEGQLLRDADILEQLGAVGIMRAVSKVGRDTRYPTHGDAIRVLRKNMLELPARLDFPHARKLAEARVLIMAEFLEAAGVEAGAAGL